MFEQLARCEGHERSVSSVKFHGDGELLASASADATVRLYDITTLQFHRELSCLHELGINDIDWDGKQGSTLLCTASDDKTIGLWDTRTGEHKGAVNKFVGHESYVMSVKFNPVFNTLVSGSFDEKVRVWDLRQTTKPLNEIKAHSDPISAVHFNYSGHVLATASYDGLCRVWDSTWTCVKTIYPQSTPPVSFVRFAGKGHFLSTSSLDSTIRLWNFVNGSLVREFTGHENDKFCIFSDFMTTGQFTGEHFALVTGSEDHAVYVYKWNGTVLQKLTGHEDVVLTVACHPTRSLIASGSMDKDKSVMLWGVSNRQAAEPSIPE